jgi:hypothetical protein
MIPWRKSEGTLFQDHAPRAASALRRRAHQGSLEPMSASEAKEPPILQHKRYGAPSAFTPENLLRQARRQKRLPDIAVPDICILDPDGDIVRNLCAAERARRHGGWACYHTELYVFRRDGHEYGIVGCAVGAAFAVLIAEELFASCCRLLVRSHPPAKSLRCKLRLILSLSTERCVMKVRAITTCRHPSTAKGMSM